MSSAAWAFQPEAVATTAADWSAELWSTARSGDADRLGTLLRGIHSDTDAGALLSLKGAAEHYQANVQQREADRALRIGEARTELASCLEQVRQDAGTTRLGEALVLALELVELQGGSLQAGDLMADPLLTETVTMALDAARSAEAAGRWLESSELFYRLHVLFDIDQRYKADIDRLSRRLSMIRLYVPELYWEMRNARRIEEGEEPLPPYNPTGDRFEDKLAGIDFWLVVKSIEVAGSRHVDGDAARGMLVTGLGGVETMATTTQLARVFPGLGDEMARQAFVAALQAERQKIAEFEREITAREIRAVVTGVLDLAKRTVKIPDEALLHEFGNGAMGSLDDYSTIIWPDEVRRFERNTRGEFVGIGVQIQHDELQRIKVVTPLEGTPAQRAGFRADDVITEVNGLSTTGFTLDQAVDVITGPANTRVTVTVEREQEGGVVEKEFTLLRSPIKLRSVKGWKRLGASEEEWDWFVDRESDIGYVRLTQFTESTAEDLRRAVDSMRGEGLSGLVLDLRFNPGGLLDQAVEVVGEFVPSGVVVTTENADGVRTGVEKVKGSGELADVPVAILVNEGSASASEIVSGALQDYAHEGKLDAIVIGKRSFGKGSVQNAWPLPTAAESMLKVTTQYYRLPGGRLIHRRPGMTEWGVEPDLSVDMLPSQNEEAITIRRDADVLPLDENGQVVVTGEAQANPDDLLTKGIDLQLEAAVVLLKSRAASARPAQIAEKTVGAGI
ncbi:MAG TPA: S41 family peptidase [Phycisphaerales bacterium]|nr:S41 family peptidase [Phycisphaerales bacterium]